MSDAESNGDWGPLGPLAGTWEGDEGVDLAYSHGRGETYESRYREKLTLEPFGPVDNGTQRLYGLDYRSAMWRGDEDLPFHTEVGYWLWDGATGEVMKCFVVPRGIALVAGGTADAAATSFTLRADQGEGPYRIAENAYLAQHACTLSFEATIQIGGPDTWSYSTTTVLRLRGIDERYPHTDRNTLHRIG